MSSSRGRRSRERWQDIIGHLSAPTAALQRPTTTTGTVNHRCLRLLHVDVVSQFCPGQLFHGQTQRAVWRRSCRQRTFGVVVAVVVAVVVVVVVVAAVASAIAIGNWQLAKRWPRLCNCLSQHCVSKWKSRLLLKELQVSRSLLPTSVALSLSLSRSASASPTSLQLISPSLHACFFGQSVVPGGTAKLNALQTVNMYENSDYPRP